MESAFARCPSKFRYADANHAVPQQAPHQRRTS
jgi:hypothetical protein